MDKKNTILLTVIAVATLLVAIVGATFAYFTAQMGEGANTNIIVTTSTQDTLSYGAFNALMLVANEENFAKSKGTQMASAEGTISLQANSNQTEEDFKAADYCYTATINVKANQFIYAPDGTIDDSKQQVTGSENPELILALSKDTHNYGDSEIDSLTYKSIGEKLVCDQTTLNKTTFDENECQNKSVAGYDVTTVGSGGETAIKINNWEAEEPAKQDPNLKYVFHIKAEQAGAITNHKWKADLYFVNYDWDQQYNTHKMFTATWNFETVDCETGVKAE